MKFESHRQIIDVVWGSVAAYAQGVETAYETARGHRQRSNIPSDYWEKVIRTAKQKGYKEVTTDLLMRLQRPRKKWLRRHEVEEIARHG